MATETKTPKSKAPGARQEVKLFTQAAPIESVNEDARTFEVIFSTGELIQHWVRLNDRYQRMWTRVELTAAAADLEYLQRNGPLLNAHWQYDTASVLGSIEDASITNNAARATVKFTTAEDVEHLWQRVLDGSLRNVSMGFDHSEYRLEQQEVGGETVDVMVFTKWRPKELSLVPIGADSGAFVQMDTSNQEEVGMPGDNQGGTAVAPTQQPLGTSAAPSTTQAAPPAAPPAEPPQTPIVDADTVRQEERARIASLQQTAKSLNVPADLLKQAIDKGTSIADFNTEAIAAFTAGDKPKEQSQGGAGHQSLGGPTYHITGDARDRFAQGAEEGFMARLGMEGGKRNEFTGFSLSELARQSLLVANAQMPHDRMSMVGLAFTQAGGAHATSDFAHILANVMNKQVLKGWTDADETFQLWTTAGVLTDFKESKRVGIGSIGNLLEVGEGADYKYGTIGDRGESIALATYGKLLKITRQAIINDDLSLFGRVPTAMGRAARRTIGNLVYAILTTNPNMADGTALFHSDRGNLGSAAAPSVTSLGAARTAMRTQKDRQVKPPVTLNIAPAYILTPAALETTVSQLLNSQVDPQASKGHASNPVAGMAQHIIEPRLDADSATAWYLAANQAVHDTIEVAYLDGVQEPWLEQKEGWTSDGVDLKVRIDAGVAPLDPLTLYKNPGQ